MAEKLKRPKFASEAERAQWWFDHRDEVTKVFEDAATEGKLQTSSVANLARKENTALGVTPPTTIRLDPDDLSRVKMLVHEALAAEEKKLAR